MKKIKTTIFLIFFSVSFGFANDTECESALFAYKRQSINLLSENDAYANQFVDRYYTAGTSIGYTSKEYDFGCEDKDSIMAWSQYISLGITKAKMTRFNIAITQSIYTPYSREINPPSGDLPYAGYLYLNLGVSHRSESMLENIFFSMGMVGPSTFAHETQKFVHYLTNNPIFYGWHNQLKNEFILNLNYQLIKKFYLWDSRYISSDFLPGLDIALGNADTHLQIGGRLRIGYNLDSDFGINKVNTSFNGAQAYNDRFSFYLFGGLSGRYQARNIFIQGNTFGHSTGLDMIYFTYDAEFGAAILYRGIRFAYTYTHASKKFKTQPLPHNFGSIELNIAF
ncbi:lipid A deacylase LpxR family protein [Helicobacter sp. 13S00477-4]|uniref:lipid A deacylase LpxR family protein n=1 Tax=Helicobacter sp. 13S00477-4 TaxID=1905759 RepID=UPI000BA722A8|nr:lipid A deacylase LpxR family protein [Helicobacter sp. 13S00477-4]PAF52686.1 hypothetical protein BKH44_00440 [Helicobacter sp. 13S00477-4]